MVDSWIASSSIAAARVAQNQWADDGIARRLKCIAAIRSLIAADPQQLAQSCGRTDIAETLAGEVLPLADACLFLEKTAAKTLCTQTLSGKGKPQWILGVKVEVRREPYGVVLIVAPSNYPLMLPGIQALQALAAGNAVLIKPAAGCTDPAEAFVDLVHKAGVDEALIRVLPESIPSVAEAVKAGVDKVVLTGSVATGRSVQRLLADELTPSAMELSGCDAVFVTASADVERTIACLAMGLRFNGGRTCIAPRRVFVDRVLLSDFEQRLKHELTVERPAGWVATRQFDSPPQPGSGSTSYSPAAVAAAGLVDSAVADGATILVDGICRTSPESKTKPESESEPFVDSCTVITNAQPQSQLLQTDVFAPVMSIVPYDDIENALTINTQCPYALGATIFSTDEQQISRIAGFVNAGCVVVNDMIVPTADPRVPFGGRGDSGFGVTRGTAGLLEMTQLKTVIQRNGNWLPHLDRPTPYDSDVLSNLISVMHSTNPLAKAKAGIGLAKAIRLQRKYRKQRPTV